MNTELINGFNNLVNTYTNAMAAVEKQADEVIIALLGEKKILNLSNIKGNFNIIFDWYDECMDSTDSHIATSVQIEMFNDIKLVQVFDEQDGVFDLSELPTDTQIEIAQRVIDLIK